MNRMSFVNYVLTFKTFDCPYGDLARDLSADGKVSKRWGVRTLKKYIECQNSSLCCLIDELATSFEKTKTNL